MLIDFLTGFLDFWGYLRCSSVMVIRQDFRFQINPKNLDLSDVLKYLPCTKLQTGQSLSGDIFFLFPCCLIYKHVVDLH